MDEDVARCTSTCHGETGTVRCEHLCQVAVIECYKFFSDAMYQLKQLAGQKLTFVIIICSQYGYLCERCLRRTNDHLGLYSEPTLILGTSITCTLWAFKSDPY